MTSQAMRDLVQDTLLPQNAALKWPVFAFGDQRDMGMNVRFWRISTRCSNDSKWPN